ncbi:DNA-binding protein, 42 kDa [Candidozyma duobushaemuli]|uniref:DNA-binding protein, 42 kDa n=1 Tax=Candidozyma duobushaemuli TaxID=1231522 RepID=A0A2V1ADL4_9ASCO|nr:DNA-binding protein, 42 kDa [[Candida] duobushaemulonis]PVH14941.1 DNA-binding protein, 42 kDa [[Candida] duobushaemulonis]
MSSKTTEIDYSINNSDVVEKYKTAGTISSKVLAEVRKALSNVYSSKKNKTSKGIAFPTCVNPNNIPAHLSPESEDDDANLTLKNGDVVNIMLGVQIDGFPAVIADTLVVGESAENPVTGIKADLLHAAWNASEAAIRTFKPGNRNFDVTNVVDKVAKDFGVAAVQSMLTHNQERDVLYGPKEEHKNRMDTHRFEESEVYGLDILVSTSADGKVKKSNFKTTLHKLTGNNYSLKLNTSRQALKAFKEKVPGHFPANVKIFEEPRKVRVGLIECSNHEVVLPYDIMEGASDSFIAQFFTTIAITKNGIVKYTSPSFNPELYKTEKKIEDEDLAKFIAEPLPEPKPKKKKKKPAKKAGEEQA